ncbi:hypothetical protein QQS21_005059 [Conoideocrella luteorostrata]|uniref:Protein kinase domain-containing protein n=1 Tax=Conoideocrella luteorostrata TaxID=1105319 RepID=A0AAJ0CSL2_9HYPO|nr:hypothetical protein QQS21_005059 [Conoideocrella luteorostrata]
MDHHFDRSDALHSGMRYSYHDIVLPPPTTAHGTYFNGTNDDVENLDEYQEGGYHPIHVSDCLGNGGRYRVIHKLGHGGFSTIWLCRDDQLQRYVAVKVMTAEVLPGEVAELSFMKNLDRCKPGAQYLALPLDNFEVHGPNGTHQCIVLPLLGQATSPELWHHLDNPGPVLRTLCHQAVQALHCLHESGIGHGDFRPVNIHVKLRDVDSLDEQDLLSLIGAPEPGDVFSSSGQDLPAGSPRYLLPAANLAKLTSTYLVPEISLIDFGGSYPVSSPPPDLGTPESYLPPEMLIDDRNDPVGPACDIWALGCTLVEIRLQMPLFDMLYGPDEVLNEMIAFFGKLPLQWWTKWKQRVDYRDEEGRPFRRRIDIHGEDFSVDSVLRGNRQHMGTVDGVMQVVKTMGFPEDEMSLLKDLLLKICAYEPRERWDTSQILRHPWFQ